MKNFRVTWRNRALHVLLACTALAVLASALMYLEYSPFAQDTLLELGNSGIFGRTQQSVPGVPAKCGNAAPLSTLPWMNPIDFNQTLESPNSKARKFLHAPALDSPIFVVGCGHSGTTELINILDRHPLIYAYLDGPGMEFAVQPNSFSSSFPVWSRRDNKWLKQLARKEHAWHWAVKSPSNICRIGYILKTVPHARIIMMVRDGRDTLLSLRERFPHKDVTSDFILGRWVNDNTAGLLYHVDPRILIVRLEDMSHHPHHWLPIILHHVGAPATWEELDTLAQDRRQLNSLRRAADLEPHLSGNSPNTTPTLPVDSFFGNTQPHALFSSKFYSGGDAQDNFFVHLASRQNRSISLVDSILTPDSAMTRHRRLNSDTEENLSADLLTASDFMSTNSSEQLAAGSADLRKRHDDLRRFQVSQPLLPTKPKWPAMDEELKTIFKENHQAMRLLRYFGYAEDSHW